MSKQAKKPFAYYDKPEKSNCDYVSSGLCELHDTNMRRQKGNWFPSIERVETSTVLKNAGILKLYFFNKTLRFEHH